MYAPLQKQSKATAKTSSQSLARTNRQAVYQPEHLTADLQNPRENQTATKTAHAGPGGAGVRLTGGGNHFRHNFAAISVFHRPVRGLQAKLTVNVPGDAYEQEADRVAEQVMRMPDPQAASTPQVSGHAAGVQRECACGGTCDDCKKKNHNEDHAKVQMKSAGPMNAGGREAPPIVHEVLRSSGQPLDASVRAFMEPRFGHDFSKVRVHTDARAAESARAVGARAYTVGSNVVFGAGEYGPQTQEGQRLLGHELTHVVQQQERTYLSCQPGNAATFEQRLRQSYESASSEPLILQRQQKTEEKQASQDIAVLLDAGDRFVTLATVLAPDARRLQVKSVDDLVKQLKTIKGSIGTLYFFGHMDEDGDILFTSSGKDDFVPAETIATKIKKAVQVKGIDLRGCNAGQSPAEIDKIRVAVQANKITGSTCTLVDQIAGPIKVNGQPITKPDDLKDPKIKTAFDAGFKKAREEFKDKKKKCIVNDSTDGYFQAGARLLAYWANPGSMADDDGWDDSKSICYKDLKVEKVDPAKPPIIGPDDCKLLEIGKK